MILSRRLPVSLPGKRSRQNAKQGRGPLSFFPQSVQSRAVCVCTTHTTRTDSCSFFFFSGWWSTVECMFPTFTTGTYCSSLPAPYVALLQYTLASAADDDDNDVYDDSVSCPKACY